MIYLGILWKDIWDITEYESASPVKNYKFKEEYYLFHEIS